MKLIRILLSPVVFLMVMAAITIFPIGPGALIGGFFIWLSDIFRVIKRPAYDRHEDRVMTFTWVVVPWYETRKWIKTGLLFAD